MRSTSTWILIVALAIAGYYAWERRAGAALAEAAPSAAAAPAAAPGWAVTTAGAAGAGGGADAGPGAAPAGAPAAPLAPAGAAAPAGRLAPAGLAAPPLLAAPSAVGAAASGAYARRAADALALGDRIGAASEGRGWWHAATGAGERAEAERFLVGLEAAAVEGANEAARTGLASAQRAELTVAYLAAPDADRRARYRDILLALADAEVLSRRKSDDAIVHAVAPGDSLARIAGRYGIPVEALQRVNGLGRSTAIRAGQSLKVPKGPVQLIAFKADFRLALLLDGRLVREYAIGIGKDDSTPEARFAIGEKQIDPTWYSPHGVFPPGDARNILGTRWLGFVDTDAHKGFGIHGTRFPESIGRAESSGCLRLRNEDVEDLYAFVPRGAEVRILR